MNRQLRRAQEKQDKKQEKDKAKRRQDRRSKVQRLRAARKRTKTVKADGPSAGSAGEAGGTRPARGGREPGKFSGALALATVFFITLQGAYPDPARTATTSLVSAGFYLMLGYFAVLWFMRRGTPRPELMTVLGGALLAISTSVAALVQDRGLDPLLLALVLPGLVLGTYLGRLVYIHTPR